MKKTAIIKNPQIKQPSVNKKMVTDGKNSYKAFNPLDRYKWHDLRNIGKFFLKHFGREKAVIINMELSNGKAISFITAIDEDSFELFDRTYIIDQKMKYEVLSAGMYAIDYHQNFSIPIKKGFDVDAIRDAVEGSGLIENTNATNPANIKRFIESSIIEQIFQGANLGKKLDLHTLLLIIILIVGLAVLGCVIWMMNKGVKIIVPS